MLQLSELETFLNVLDRSEYGASGSGPRANDLRSCERELQSAAVQVDVCDGLEVPQRKKPVLLNARASTVEEALVGRDGTPWGSTTFSFFFVKVCLKLIVFEVVRL